MHNMASLNKSEILQSALESLLENPILSDVVIESSGREWALHKCILAIRSQVFAAMFIEDFKKEERQQDRVAILDVNTDALDLMIQYIYTDRVVSMVNLEVDLYYLADRYRLPELKGKCEAQLLSIINVDNCLNILLSAINYSLQYLVVNIRTYLSENMPQICKQDKWMSFVTENPEIAVIVMRDHFDPSIVFLRTPLLAVLYDSEALRSALSTLLEQQTFSDVILKVEGRQWAVHRCILAMRSEVFATMFTSDFKEKNEKEIDIEDVDPGAFNLMIKFIYTDSVADMKDLEIQLLRLADRFQIPGLKAKCSKVLASKLDVDNCLDTLLIATNYNVGQSLVKAAKDFIVSKLPLICPQTKLLSFVKENPELSVEIMRAYCKRCPAADMRVKKNGVMAGHKKAPKSSQRLR